MDDMTDEETAGIMPARQGNECIVAGCRRPRQLTSAYCDACWKIGTHRGEQAEQPEPPARRAPSLQEVRENRAIFERIEQAKAEFRRTMEGLVPDMETEVRVRFKARPGLPEMRQLGAEYRAKALDGGDKPCECGTWDAWAKVILAGRGTYHIGEDAREQLAGIIARYDRERGDAHASTARALGLAERADEERRRLYESNVEANRVIWQLRDVLLRCQCGSPDAKPDPEYVADRVAAIRSSAAPRWRPA